MQLSFLTRAYLELTDADRIALDALLQHASPISGIKYIRARFGLHLADAKRAYEAYRDLNLSNK